MARRRRHGGASPATIAGTTSPPQPTSSPPRKGKASRGARSEPEAPAAAPLPPHWTLVRCEDPRPLGAALALAVDAALRELEAELAAQVPPRLALRGSASITTVRGAPSGAMRLNVRGGWPCGPQPRLRVKPEPAAGRVLVDCVLSDHTHYCRAYEAAFVVPGEGAVALA